MSIDLSILILGGVNLATLAFGYGVLWTQVRTLKDLVTKLENLIDTLVLQNLNDHERRLIIIEQKHDRCDA